MFKNFVAYCKRTLGSEFMHESMSQVRYFPNQFDDYDVTSLTVPEPNLKEIKNHIDEIITRINSRFRATERNSGDGLYLGTAGVAYMFYKLSKNPLFEKEKDEILAQAVEYIKPAITVAKYNTRHPSDMPSFILGNSGVFALAAAIYAAVGEENQTNQFIKIYQDAGNICKELRFLNCGSDELFVGRAGYVLGALWLAKESNTQINVADISEICTAMVNSGREHAKYFKSACPLMYSYYQIEYLGAAHGISSILQALMSVPGFLDSNPAIKEEVKICVDYLLSLQDQEGNFPAAIDEIGHKSELVHWCHGAGGMVYLMAKAYIVFNDPKYIDSCKKMAELVWNKGLLKKGPGICHGVSGNGYVFLLLYRLTMNITYLHRALRFYEFMYSEEFKNDAKIPDHPYSLYEGIAGQACFLGDLAQPNQAHFPFSDVF